MCLGIPGQVVELEGDSGELPTALVEFAGIRRRVCMACVPDATPGDYVIVHAGIAISRIDAVEAQRVFAYLDEIGDSDGWGRDGPGDAPTTGQGEEPSSQPADSSAVQQLNHSTPP